MEGLGKKMAKGAAWMLLFKLTERSLGLISTIILARLLLPDDFGLVAMAMSVIAVLELLSAFGFDIVLIQNQKAGRKHYDTAWTFNVLFAIFSAACLAALAIPTAGFYKEPELEIVMYSLSLGFLVQGFENIGIVDFRKNMEFNKEFNFLLGKKLISFCVTVPLAFYLRNYWALVIGIVTGKLAGMALSYWFHSYRPRFSLQARHELFHFSKWLLINNILNFLRFRSVDFIIGRYSGTRALGLFNISFEISNLPTTEMVAPINRAVFPGYAKMANDLAILRQAFLNTISLIALFALPAALGITVTAEYIVKVFLGSNWLDAIPLIEILAVFGAVISLQTNIGSVFLAINKPRVLSILSFASLLVLAPLVFSSINDYGTIGVAWSYLISALIMLPIYYYVTFKYINLNTFVFLRFIWRPIISSILMYYSTEYMLQALTNEYLINNSFILLIIGILFGAIIYSMSILLFWLISSKPEGAETFVLDKIKNRMRKQ